MHDGRFFDLNAVMTHYTSQVKESSTLDSLLRNPSGATGIELTPLEVDHILLFINTLNDENFIKNYELSEFAVKK
jgi:cytochrome c peroxidase